MNSPDEDNTPTAPSSGSTSLRGHRGGLTKGTVVQAAIDLIDAHGLEALSMRRLGAALGVQGMTLYRYVDNREGLLDAVVDRVMDQLYASPDVLLRPEDTWQDFLRRVADGVRRVAVEHPHLTPLIATRPPAAPWIRPPLRSLRWVEGLLSGLTSRGFERRAAVYAYRSFTTLLVGHSLLEASAATTISGPHPDDAGQHPDLEPGPAGGPLPPGPDRTDDPERVTEPDGTDSEDDVRAVADLDLDVSAYPTVTRLARQLAEGDLDTEFADALDDLLERLTARRGTLQDS